MFCRFLISLAVVTLLNTGWSLPAVTPEAAVGDIAVRVYAPDWIWQGQAVNMLIVAENRGATVRTLTVRLRLPEHDANELRFDAALQQQADIPPGHTGRLAFTRLIPAAGFPLRAYACTLEFNNGAEAVEIPCAFRTVRGPAVTPGIWSALIPVGITLVWCLAFLALLPRLAARGAWKTPSPVFEDSE